MKNLLNLFVILGTSTAYAGGMISAEPVELVSVYNCKSTGIDVTHPVKEVAVEFAYEKGDPKKTINTMIAYDRYGNRAYYVGLLDKSAILIDIAGVGFKFDFYRYRNHQTKTGQAIVAGGKGFVRPFDINRLPELVLTGCKRI